MPTCNLIVQGIYSPSHGHRRQTFRWLSAHRLQSLSPSCIPLLCAHARLQATTVYCIYIGRGTSCHQGQFIQSSSLERLEVFPTVISQSLAKLGCQILVKKCCIMHYEVTSSFESLAGTKGGICFGDFGASSSKRPEANLYSERPDI